MVGTFYEAPSPHSNPLVQTGDEINKETVVCITEAMKIMNGVEAGMEDTVRELLAVNSHPVECGQVFFRIAQK